MTHLDIRASQIFQDDCMGIFIGAKNPWEELRSLNGKPGNLCKGKDGQNFKLRLLVSSDKAPIIWVVMVTGQKFIYSAI